MDPRRPNRAPSNPMVRQVGFVTPGTHPTSLSRSHSVPADATSPYSPPSGDLSAATSISPVMIPPPLHNSVPVPVPLSPVRRDNIQIPIGSYNHLNDSSLPGTSPGLPSPSSSSRFDVGSEFSDDMSVSTPWGERGGAGKAASSFPGSSGEMMAMKAGGNANAAPAPKSVMTTASVVKTVPGLTGSMEMVLDSHSTNDFPVAHKRISLDIKGNRTDLVMCNYDDNLLVMVTQIGCMGTIVHARKEADVSIDPTFNVSVVFGKRDEPLLVACARQLIEHISLCGSSKPLVLSLGLKDHSPGTLKDVIAAVIENRLW